MLAAQTHNAVGAAACGPALPLIKANKQTLTNKFKKNKIIKQIKTNKQTKKHK